ncbi:MAG: hypothetical protein IJ228_02320 [Succinivibrio sp.]|nr:hypothetical protein [Succinivibrio sp.]
MPARKFKGKGRSAAPGLCALLILLGAALSAGFGNLNSACAPAGHASVYRNLPDAPLGGPQAAPDLALSAPDPPGDGGSSLKLGLAQNGRVLPRHHSLVAAHSQHTAAPARLTGLTESYPTLPAALPECVLHFTLPKTGPPPRPS